MGIATFKDLCIDASSSETLGRFWAAALGLDFIPDGEAGSLVGDTANKRIWMNVVPETKTVKHRVHIDVNTGSVDDLVALGGIVLEPAAEFDRHWTVMADPEGGEFCAFVREPAELSAYRFHEVVVDAVNPKAITQWWADVFECGVGGREDRDWWWLLDVPGLPFDGWDFVPVPEPKTVKNRIHWDVNTDSVDALVEAGATVLTPSGADRWTVMADPEGNEFCAFVREG